MEEEDDIVLNSDSEEEREKLQKKTDEEKKQEQMRKKEKLEEMAKFREQLPIQQFQSQIIEIVKKHDFCILTGDTGSGKSTQLPQYILDSLEIKNQIFHKIYQDKKIEAVRKGKEVQEEDGFPQVQNVQTVGEGEEKQDQELVVKVNQNIQNLKEKQIELEKEKEEVQQQDQQQEQLEKEGEQLDENLERQKEILKQNQKLKESVKRDFFEKESLKIVITQPRRVAAISMARRICEERGEKLGDKVGYTIRFDDKSSENTHLKYVTDGILVRECLNDRDLSKYQVIILDEAHERSLSTDVLFALVKQAVKRRNGSLKLIVTSATLNTDQFSKFFENAPVLKMTGRSYPVDIKYTVKPGGRRVDEAVKAAIRMHLHEGPGDILIFLTGKEECEQGRRLCIQELQRLVANQREVPNALIYTLYGAQHHDEQQQVFKKAEQNTRKIIFSTNIAETSLTIDGIGFVIDCGYVKQKTFNPRTGMDALIIVPISRVEAIQRTGRAGRTQEGKCFRLYSEQFYREQMKENLTPEILRVNLANVILGLKDMKIHDVLNFDFMEKPDQDQILQALRQLYLLDAIDENGNITNLGHQMCRFPLEPSYSKSLITSILFGVEDKMLSLVSLLSSEQIWAKPPRAKEEEYKFFEQQSLKNMVLDGDHETLVTIMNRWRKNGYSEEFCRANFLNSRCLKMAENIKVQLKDIAKGTNLEICKPFYKNDPIYKIFKSAKLLDRDYLKRNPKYGYNNEDHHSKKEKKDKYKQKHKDEKIELTPTQVFKLAITHGFYFNTARKMNNSQEAYILVFSENGNIVEMDPQSVYVQKEYYPNYVIYTELGGTSVARGVIRLVSEIEQDWIQQYNEKYKKVDMFQLAGIITENKQKLLEVRKKFEEEQEKKKEQELTKEQKKQLALQKLQERKKLKK